MANASNISISNTFFKHKLIHKTTWTSPDGNTKNEIDYICISTRRRSSLLDVRSYRGADVGSDHNMVIGKFCLKLKKVKLASTIRPYAIGKLQYKDMSEKYHKEVVNRFQLLDDVEDLEEQWKLFMQAVKDSAETVLGRRRGTNKERWISDNSWDLTDKCKVAKSRRDQARTRQKWTDEDLEFRNLDKRVKISCHNDKKKWLENKAAEAQHAADINDSKTLYRIVRELSGTRSGSDNPIKAKDGTTLASSGEQAKRWTEHFAEVLNQPVPATLFEFNQQEAAQQLDVSVADFTVQEVIKAIAKQKNNKAAGVDEIPTELLKHGQDELAEKLTNVFNTIWHIEDVPDDWQQGVILPLPKKGCLSDCNNWRGITLMSVPGKTFCTVLLNRLNSEVDRLLREEQAGFRHGRSCSEQIFTLRNIMEQRREFQTPLSVNYIEFKKAFDSIHRESLWKSSNCMAFQTNSSTSSNLCTATQIVVLRHAMVSPACLTSS